MKPPYYPTLALSQGLSCIALWVTFSHTVWLFAADRVLPAATGGEQIQNSIGTRLDDLMKSYRDKQMSRMQRSIQDIKRATQLPESRVQLLRIAAKGAIEQGLSAARARMQSDADTRTKGLGPGPAANALKSLSNDNFYMPPASRETLWIQSVDSILSSTERSRYQSVVDERQAYRSKAMAGLLAIRARQILGLGSVPANKLKILMERTVTDYWPDLAGWYGGDEEDIYSGYLFCLLLGIPDKELQPLLTAEQLKKWPSCAGDNGGMWPEIKRMHEERVKREKTKP